MRYACLDVGYGTLDILVYDDTRSIENATTLVVPSPVVKFEKMALCLLTRGSDLLLTGWTMGGFKLDKLSKWIKATDRKIYALADAARSFDDDLDVVKGFGIEIIDEEKAEELRKADGLAELIFRDVDVGALGRALTLLGDADGFDRIGVAVQDHGAAPPGVSDRRFRFQYMQELLSKGFSFEEVTYDRDSIPGRFTRMLGVAASIPEKFDLRIMDTGFASLSGLLMDGAVAAFERKVLVNVGNGHTLAMFVDHGEVPALFEHHTSVLSGEMLWGLTGDLVQGKVTNDLVFSQNGHGAFLSSTHKFRDRGGVPVFVTGPNRSMLEGFNCSFPAPFGNMMLTGAYGLLRAFGVEP